MQPGDRLGPYEVLSLIGSGGMGEVWKARDSRLDRTVAIKHCRERFSDRFGREAHAIAALTHPHICTLYDVGPDYLVMEFVDGRPLRCPAPPKQVLEIGAQIADALHCAHSKGVVHRDLKPANILVTKSGVKLVDFGLAKTMAPAAHGGSAAPTETLTEEKTIIGTLQYMSPEQLEGKPADPRSDIFALGIVMFEMICGRPPFRGGSQASLIAAILKEEPPPLAPLAPLISSALDHVVRRCLAKDREARWQSAADVRDELKWIEQISSETATAQRASKPASGRWVLRAAAVAALAVLLFIGIRLSSPTREIAWTGERLGGPELALGPRISPDGHLLAFQAMLGQNTQVAVMRPGSGNWQVLTHKADAGWVNEISWSADGNKIYFDRFWEVPRGVYSVPALGGDEQLILDDAFAPQALRDGSLLAVKINDKGGFQLFRFWPDSGRLQGLPVELNSSWGPSSVLNSTLLRASPDGKEAFALCRPIGKQDEPLRLYVINLESAAMRPVRTDLAHDDAILALAPGMDSGTILASVQSSDVVRVVAFSRTRRSPARTLFTVTDPLPYLDSGPGGAIYGDQWDASGLLLRFPRRGGHAEKIGFLPPGNSQTQAPLGSRVAILVGLGSRARLMVLDPGKDPVPLLNTTEEINPPLTRVGASEIALLIGPASNRSIALVSAVNGRITQRIPFDKGLITSLSASPDGKTIYCTAGGAVWAVPRDGESRKICAGHQVAAEPDGRTLLVKLLEPPKARLVNVALDGTPVRELPLSGPLHLGWQTLGSGNITADGRMYLPLLSPDSWFSAPGIVDLTTGKMAGLPVDHFGDYVFLSLTPDGQVMAAVHDYRFSIWRFRAEARAQ